MHSNQQQNKVTFCSCAKKRTGSSRSVIKSLPAGMRDCLLEPMVCLRGEQIGTVHQAWGCLYSAMIRRQSLPSTPSCLTLKMLRNSNLYCSILSVSFQAVRLLHTDSPRRGNSALQYLLLLAFKAPQFSVGNRQRHPHKLDQNGADLLTSVTLSRHSAVGRQPVLRRRDSM